MSVKLRKRNNADGSTSLLLDIYHNGKRYYEFLKELKLIKPANLIDRQHNKENLQQAQDIAVKRAQELSANDYGMITDIGRKTIVADWMQNYVSKYFKKDKRNMQGSLNRFSHFLIENGRQGLTFGLLTDLVISDFQDYLREHSTGEGASSYFARFKKMVKQAFKLKLILINPAAEVKTIQGHAKKKDTLTLDEIQLLVNTPIASNEVKRAFLFCCMAGLRWCDISTMKWKNINIKNGTLNLAQNKTERDLSINLNDSAIKLIGKSKDPEELVFNLPTANGANKTVKAWIRRAGIEKNITWHNARHSFGTNLVFYGADVTTASNLLGHTSLKHTQRYVTAAKELKERATDRLNIDL